MVFSPVVISHELVVPQPREWLPQSSTGPSTNKPRIVLRLLDFLYFFEIRKNKEKVVSSESLLETTMRPPWASMIFWQRCNPNP